MGQLNDLSKEVYQRNVAKGWWEEPADQVYDSLRARGFEDATISSIVDALKKGNLLKARDPLAVHMLMVTELAEASEEVRNGRPPLYALDMGSITEDLDLIRSRKLKPEGELTELADVVIRILDKCGREGWDLEQAIELKMAYNLTRPYRHGGKSA